MNVVRTVSKPLVFINSFLLSVLNELLNSSFTNQSGFKELHLPDEKPHDDALQARCTL